MMKIKKVARIVLCCWIALNLPCTAVHLRTNAPPSTINTRLHPSQASQQDVAVTKSFCESVLWGVKCKRAPYFDPSTRTFFPETRTSLVQQCAVRVCDWSKWYNLHASLERNTPQCNDPTQYMNNMLNGKPDEDNLLNIIIHAASMQRHGKGVDDKYPSFLSSDCKSAPDTEDKEEEEEGDGHTIDHRTNSQGRFVDVAAHTSVLTGKAGQKEELTADSCSCCDQSPRCSCCPQVREATYVSAIDRTKVPTPTPTSTAEPEEEEEEPTKATLCETDEYVSDNACVSCAVGTTNESGDDASDDDTECAATLCETDEYVSDNACVSCAVGTTNESGDDASDDDTECAVSTPEPTCNVVSIDGREDPCTWNHNKRHCTRSRSNCLWHVTCEVCHANDSQVDG